MDKPYASVILPTHDRHTTLPYSIRSILQQSVQDIELIIVGDGCSNDVRQVCKDYQSRDSRIRFLDLPKAPHRGSANRDIGVRAARSDRIFYSDDDDLFLPHHIEILGSALDKYDIVDTPPISVAPEGFVCLGLLNSAHPKMRQMLVDEKFKGVFDTHLAHRKSIYTESAGAWLNISDYRVVLHMLKTFASRADVSWHTLFRVTALSFHGVRRVCMTAKDRARELAAWYPRLGLIDFEKQLLNESHFAGHVMRLLPILARDHLNNRDLFGSIGLQLSEGERILKKVSPPPMQFHTLSSQQNSELAALEVFVRTKTCTEEELNTFLEYLLPPLLSPYYSTRHVVGTLKKFLSYDEINSCLHCCNPGLATWLAKFHLDMIEHRQEQKHLIDAENQFGTAPGHSRFFFGFAVAEVLFHQKLFKTSWQWSEKLYPLAPTSRLSTLFWRLRLNLANELGFNDQADLARIKIAEWEESPI